MRTHCCFRCRRYFQTNDVNETLCDGCKEIKKMDSPDNEGEPE